MGYEANDCETEEGTLSFTVTVSFGVGGVITTGCVGLSPLQPMRRNWLTAHAAARTSRTKRGERIADLLVRKKRGLNDVKERRNTRVIYPF
jgi:hypothetical protein